METHTQGTGKSSLVGALNCKGTDLGVVSGGEG